MEGCISFGGKVSCLRLRRNMLEARREDVVDRVQGDDARSLGRLVPLPAVSDWILRAGAALDKADALLLRIKGSESLFSECRYGKKVVDMYKEVDKLYEEGKFKEVTSKLPVQPLPCGPKI